LVWSAISPKNQRWGRITHAENSPYSSSLAQKLGWQKDVTLDFSAMAGQWLAT